MTPDGLKEQLAQLPRQGLFVRLRVALAKSKFVKGVAGDLRGIDGHHRAGRDPADMFEQGERFGAVAEADIGEQGLRIQFAVERTITQEGLDFGSEQDSQALPPVIERLDSVAVARQMKQFVPGIPQGKGEDAVEPFDEVNAPFLVAMDQHLGVGARAEPVACRE